jgi:hypothetical protein
MVASNNLVASAALIGLIPLDEMLGGPHSRLGCGCESENLASDMN